MRRKDDRAVGRAIGQFLHKHGPFGAQVIDDVFVMHNLVPHIDGCAPFFQGEFDDLDGPVHARAKATWRSKVEGQGGQGHAGPHLCADRLCRVAARVHP
jgi:hypothetical protein